jgi:hypothetical protein
LGQQVFDVKQQVLSSVIIISEGGQHAVLASCFQINLELEQTFECIPSTGITETSIQRPRIALRDRAAGAVLGSASGAKEIQFSALRGSSVARPRSEKERAVVERFDVAAPPRSLRRNAVLAP